MKLLQFAGVCLLLLPGPLLAAAPDSLLTALNQALAHRAWYDGRRVRHLRQLRAEFNAPGTNDSTQFATGLRIYEEYKAFQYDSAFAYCQRLERLARRLHDPDRLASAHLKLTFILLSTGLFKEAAEALTALDPRLLAGDRRLEYYLMQARANGDLAEFSRDQFYRPRYAARALAYSDTVLRLSQDGSPLRLELQEDLASQTNQLAAGVRAYRLSYVQLRRLRATSGRLAAASRALVARNDVLTATNATLAEANAIKEEYVGYSFYYNAQYLDKLVAVKKNLDLLANTRQVTGLHKLAGSIDVKQARSELVSGFDLVFLRLFPNFLTQFNALFPPAERVQPTEGQLLTTELRIFALIRLGIQDNERISRMLGYSINTIYTYKTRVKNRSLVPNEEFEARVLAIQGA